MLPKLPKVQGEPVEVQGASYPVRAVARSLPSKVVAVSFYRPSPSSVARFNKWPPDPVEWERKQRRALARLRTALEALDATALPSTLDSTHRDS